jgi:AcrR family transcriptional regulator
MEKSLKHTQIVDTAIELFRRFGSRRVSIEELCQKAGVSKVTFYKYFENKADLIRHIRDEMIEVIFSRFDEISVMEIPYPEKIDLMTRWRVEFFSNMNEEFVRELYMQDEVVEEAKRRFLQNTTDAQQKGEVRTDLSPEFIWFITEKLNGIIRDGSWKTVFDEYSTFQKQMRTLFFYGLLTREGDDDVAGGQQ